MRKTKLILFVFVSCGLFAVSCRDTDNQKDLNGQQDGNRDINTTELNEMDNRSSADTLDTESNRGVGEDVYRANDIPQEQNQQRN